MSAGRQRRNGAYDAVAMRIRELHPWHLTPREAVALQRELASRVRRSGSPRDVRLIAGADVAFDRAHGRAAGAVVALEYPSLEVVESVTIEAAIGFPYVPGLLSFRETPVLLRAFERLRAAPDIVMADGHGYAHPRKFGFACHLGLLLDTPTIGVAKSLLVGGHAGIEPERGSVAALTHEGERIGAALRTRDGVRPVYVSVGHRIGLDTAVAWALRCARGRVPEPTRTADRAAGDAKRHMLRMTLPIVIEQRAGEAGRWEWVAGDDQVVFRHELIPMPVHYGCSNSIMNPADNELLDVMVLPGASSPERGERMDVRVVDVLLRADGDHKLLALPLHTDPHATATKRRLAAARREIERWFTDRGRVLRNWAGEEGALRVIEECEKVAQ